MASFSHICWLFQPHYSNLALCQRWNIAPKTNVLNVYIQNSTRSWFDKNSHCAQPRLVIVKGVGVDFVSCGVGRL